ncbi:MAG: dTDP-4-dehydrorhamnose reductase [Steroidobacteraceae bacterium]
MTTLVLGSTGQLATHLRELWPDAVFWSRTEADLAEPRTLRGKVESARPAAIVIAAAHTAVDKAESEPELAWRINAEAPAEIARAAATLDVPLVHVSTDYVFDGCKATPYVEDDPVGPLNVYGRSKLGGELAVQSIATRYWILRTSWVFSEHGQNFVKTMLRLGRDRDTLSVVADQLGRPTYAGDLARVIAELLRPTPAAVPFGLLHVGGGPATTWHGFAVAIFEGARAAGMLPGVPVVHAIPTSQYPTPARRPLSSVLEPSAALQQALSTHPDWRDGLNSVLRALAVQTA